MYGITVKLTPNRSFCPLVPITVGAGSDAYLIIEGIPQNGTGWQVRLYLTQVGQSVPVYFDAASGENTIYIPGANFPTAGTGAQYEIVITEIETGRKYWMGRGELNVSPASFEGGNPGMGTSLESYIRNPTTGLWHKVTAHINDDGDVTSEVSQEGVQL